MYFNPTTPKMSRYGETITTHNLCGISSHAGMNKGKLGRAEGPLNGQEVLPEKGELA